MHKIIIFILITLSISSFSCKTNHEDSDKICIDNFRILLFRNFNDGNTKIPNEILKNNTNEFYYYNVISISKLISFNKNLVTGDTFVFLCQNVFLLSWEDFNKMAFINGHDFGHGSFDDFVIKESKDLKIYYVGKYFVKHNIDSYLFLFETQYERGGHLFRLYLINSQNNAITSIVKVADFFRESETINGYTVRCSINNFVYNREHNSSDMLVPSNEKDIFLTPSCVYFIINKDGFVVVKNEEDKKYKKYCSKEKNILNDTLYYGNNPIWPIEITNLKFHSPLSFSKNIEPCYLNPYSGLRVSGVLFDFLSRNTFLNGWDEFLHSVDEDYYYSVYQNYVEKYNEYVDSIQNETSIYFYGKFNVIENIDTYLFLIESKSEKCIEKKSLYLINSENRYITSIVELTGINQSKENKKTYRTVRESKNRFITIEETFGKMNESYCISYKFTERGFLLTL